MKVRLTGLAVAVIVAAPAIAFAQLPSSYKTPGATTKASAKQICAAGYESTVKPVANWQKVEALGRYGLRPDSFAGDLDHLIPVALGGSNDPDNLWPLHDSGELTAAAKDQLATKLRELVCADSLTLKAAQDAMRKDWVKAYQQYIKSANAK